MTSTATPRTDPALLDALREDLAAADVQLAPELIRELEALINHKTVSGNRYSEQSSREVDAEVFPG